MKGHTYRRGKRWTAVFDAGVREDGKRRQISRGGFGTQREALAFIRTELGRLDRGEYVEPSRMTLATFVTDEWLPTVQTALRRTSFEAYRRVVRKHVLPALGGRPIQRVTSGQLTRLYGELVDAGLSPATVHFIAAVVGRLFADAERMRLVPRNVAREAIVPRVPTRRMSVWSGRELGRFLDAVADDRLHALWRLLGVVGLRRGEALALRWLDFDAERGRISVNASLVPVEGAIIRQEPKTSSGRRTISLDPDSVTAIEEHRVRQLLERSLLADAYVDEDLILCREDGRPLDPRGVSARFSTVAKAAGVPKIRLHDLRHTAATLGLAAGVPARVMQERLGHANVGLTLSLYSHVLPGMQEDAALRIASVLAR